VGIGRGDERPPLLRDVGLDARLGALVPRELAFRDESGKAVTLGQYFDDGRPVLLSFVYFGCPMLCGQVTNAVTAALRTLSLDAGKDFTVLTVSFDPRDGPEVARQRRLDALRRYGRPAAESGWHFLTGDDGAIRALTDAVGFRYAWDDVGKQFAHVGVIMVLTPEGRVARYFPGIEYPPRDLRLGLVEASAGRIGTTVDRLLLYCYRFNGATGRYTPIIENAVRAGAVLTLAALGALVIVLRRQESRT
jgi:protein SCO1/2